MALIVFDCLQKTNKAITNDYIDVLADVLRSLYNFANNCNEVRANVIVFVFLRS